MKVVFLKRHIKGFLVQTPKLDILIKSRDWAKLRSDFDNSWDFRGMFIRKEFQFDPGTK